MQVQSAVDTGSAMALRRLTFPAIRWSAIFAGSISGLASYLLLSLLGVAIGLTAVGPADTSAGTASTITGIWMGISMLISAFIGGYVAARMSGLARRSDGILHGFVSWGVTTILFAWLATSAVGNILGGAFSLASQGAQAGAQGGGGAMSQSLERMIAGSPNANVTPEGMASVQDRLQAGDRQGAMDILVNRMGFSEERARQVVDQAGSASGGGAGQMAQQAAGKLSIASWVLFLGVILSLLAGVWGGSMGVRAIDRRTLEDHTDERQVHHY